MSSAGITGLRCGGSRSQRPVEQRRIHTGRGALFQSLSRDDLCMIAFQAEALGLKLHRFPSPLLHEIISTGLRLPRRALIAVARAWAERIDAARPGLAPVDPHDLRQLFNPGFSCSHAEGVRHAMDALGPFFANPRSNEGRACWARVEGAIRSELEEARQRQILAPEHWAERAPAARSRRHRLFGGIAALAFAEAEALPPNAWRLNRVESLRAMLRAITPPGP